MEWDVVIVWYLRGLPGNYTVMAVMGTVWQNSEFFTFFPPVNSSKRHTNTVIARWIM